MGAQRRNPFRGFLDVWGEMHRMREEWDEPATESQRRGHASAWAPTTDIFARGEDMVIRCALPGVRREDIDVSLSGGVLTISGERKLPQSDAESPFYISEWGYGTFRRSIRVPENIEDEDIEAALSEGSLEIVIVGGAGAPGPRRISIGDLYDSREPGA